MRKLSSIQGNSQRLDGGAMFGNAPKALWSKWIDCDDLNRVELSTRALLIEEECRNIMLETGVGCFFEPQLKQRYGVNEEHHVLLDSLAAVGLTHEDIDIIILSHLHFDHAGGLLQAWQQDGGMQLLFPNAIFMVGEEAWQRACHPHPRDRASYIPGLTTLLQQSNRLQRVSGRHSALLGSDYQFHISNGHTPGMMLTEISMPDGPVVFAADLVPGTIWVHLPLSMGYDRFPEKLIEEKKLLLDDLLGRNGRLFYTHDPCYCLSAIERDINGRYKAISMQQEIIQLES